jgi:hypothetical protein
MTPFLISLVRYVCLKPGGTIATELERKKSKCAEVGGLVKMWSTGRTMRGKPAISPGKHGEPGA